MQLEYEARMDTEEEQRRAELKKAQDRQVGGVFVGWFDVGGFSRTGGDGCRFWSVQELHR